MRFSLGLYNISIFFLRIVIRIAANFQTKANLFLTGRKHVFIKAKNDINPDLPLAWFHCASLGEFEQARPIIESFKENFSNYKILITFFSPSGYEVKKNYEHADHVYYLPYDTEKNANQWLDTINPNIVFFIKYEFWYHYFNEINKRNIPLLSVSTIFRDGQIFFKSFGKLQREILKKVSHFFVQNKKSVQLLHEIGINQVTLSGDTRFDRVYEIAQKAESIAIAKAFAKRNKTWVLGSIWDEDMEILLPFINHDTGNHKFIIAPHEVTQAGIAKLEKQLTKPFVKYSQANLADLENYDVLFIDNVGMLSSIYQYGDYGYIGGAYGKGLHNILEAATFGMPIFFGNRKYRKFQEALDLIRLEAAFAVADYHQFNEQFQKLNHEVASTIARSYVKDHTGATQKIIKHCQSILAS